MNNPQIIPHGLLYSVAPENFAQLHISDDSFGNDFDWDESENQYEGESLASNVLEFLKEIAAK
jgi:hypothetical protein